MSGRPQEGGKPGFPELISILALVDIQVLQIHIERRSADAVEAEGQEISITWSQAYHRDDPQIDEEKKLIVHPRFELSVSAGKQPVYEQVSAFRVIFEIRDRAIFGRTWADENVKKVFLEKQVMKTIWPFFRQQVMDGMTRVGLKPVTLPWIVP
jgi:hypothetical protein